MSNIFTFTDGCSIDLDTQRPTVNPRQLAELKQNPEVYKLFKDRINAFNRARYHAKTKADPEYKKKLQAQRREWRKSPEGKKHLATYMREYRHGSLQARIASSIRCTIYAGLFRGTNIAPAEAYLGRSIADYKQYLEERFLAGMSWENYGLGIGKWCIDHIKSVATFDLTKPEQVRECFAYQNTCPIWFQANPAKWQKEKANSAPISKSSP